MWEEERGLTLTAAIHAAFSSVDRVRHSFLTEGFVHSAAPALLAKRLRATVREEASCIQRMMVVRREATLVRVGRVEPRSSTSKLCCHYEAFI